MAPAPAGRKRIESVGADAGVAFAQLPRQRRPVHPAGVVGLEIEEVVAVGVGFQQVDWHGLTRSRRRYFRQNASKCQPNRRTRGLGMALKVPTKRRL